ncbi:hypothetical protein Tco_0876601 [Tanacetum coccineum]|uniref:Uncharacterized protein n=1 Tax=Tanacetum coccineum TaxID=301880 RepID=A0ABQ5BSQ2_9ASTR
MKNKVEAQPRKVNKKNRIIKPICDDNVKHLKSNANSDLNCATCKKSLFDDVHDKCLLDFVKTVNRSAKSAKKHKKQNIWRPTGHVFTEVGLKWKPIGRTFTIVGCPDCSLVSGLRMFETHDRESLSAHELFSLLQEMEDHYMTMEEYVQYEIEKALRNGKVYNWETTTYGKIRYVDDINDLRFFETKFRYIVYKDALTSELEFLEFSSEPTLDTDNDDDKINIKQSSRDISIEPLRNVISIDVSTYAQGSNKLLETSHDAISKLFTAETFIAKSSGLEVGWIRRIQELDTTYWGFLRVGTTLDIFQNIILIPYLEYDVLILSGYGVLIFIPLWSLVSAGTDTPYLP